MSNQELKYHALKILEECPYLTQRQLSERLGVSLGKTNYLLRSLIDVGWIKLNNFQNSDRKLRYLYLLTPRGVAQKAVIAVEFLNRKKREYDQLQIDIDKLKEEVQQQGYLKNPERFND